MFSGTKYFENIFSKPFFFVLFVCFWVTSYDFITIVKNIFKHLVHAENHEFSFYRKIININLKIFTLLTTLM